MLKALTEYYMTLLQNLREPLSGNKPMICIKTDIPEEMCKIDDNLKAIYHSKDTVCIWIFRTREDRNKFMDETVGFKKMIDKVILIIFINKLRQFSKLRL